MTDELQEQIDALLLEYGTEMTLEMIRILKTGGKMATGALINSLSVDIKHKGEAFLLEIDAVDYAVFVEYGRAPGKWPPIDKIREWAAVKGIPAKAVYPIARSIKENGIKAFPFLTSYQKYISPLAKSLEVLLAKDIEIGIKSAIETGDTYRLKSYK